MAKSTIIRALQMTKSSTLLLAIAIVLTSVLAVTSNQTSVSAACSALPTDRGTATVTVNIPSNGTYRVWSRILAPTSGSNSYFLQIDEAHCGIVVGDASIATNTYTWVDYRSGNTGNKIDIQLTKGNHTIKVAGREDNVRIDKMLFISNTSCVPTGFGDNCASSSTEPDPPEEEDDPTPPESDDDPVVVPIGGGGDNEEPVDVSGTVSLQPASLDEDTEHVEYYVDGQAVEGGTLDTTTLSDGEHEVEIRQYKKDGTIETSTSKIRIDNDKSVWGNIVEYTKDNPWIVGGGALFTTGVLGTAGYFVTQRYPGAFGNLWQRLRSLWRKSPPMVTIEPPLTPPTEPTSTNRVIYPDDWQPPTK